MGTEDKGTGTVLRLKALKTRWYDAHVSLSPGRAFAAIVGRTAGKQRALQFLDGGADPPGSAGGWGRVQPSPVATGHHYRGQYVYWGKIVVSSAD